MTMKRKTWSLGAKLTFVVNVMLDRQLLPTGGWNHPAIFECLKTVKWVFLCGGKIQSLHWINKKVIP